MALLYWRAGCLTDKNGGFRPGQMTAVATARETELRGATSGNSVGRAIDVGVAALTDT